MTQFSEVYTYALANIDDYTLLDDLKKNPAVFYNRMWGYMLSAIPKFDKPPEMESRLNYVEPKFTDKYVLAVDGQTEYNTGIAEMELCVSSVDGQRIASDYNQVNGIVTIKEPLEKDVEICFDFYSDGYFVNDLNIYEKDILGWCFYYVWEIKLGNTDIDRKPKIRDRSFEMPAEAPLTHANTAKAKFAYNMLQIKIADYNNRLNCMTMKRRRR